MTNKYKGLDIARKLCFVLAAVLFLVSNFLPLFGKSKTSTSTYAGLSYLTLVTVFSYVFLLITFVVGFVLVMFYSKKYLAIGSGLNLISPITCLVVFLNVFILTASSTSSSTTDSSSTSVSLKIGVGAILMLVSIVLYIVSYVCYIISNLLVKEIDDNDIDRRIELVKSYKACKEEGIISEEEFQAKKNEILQLSTKKESKK